jgi:hypothetical protein
LLVWWIFVLVFVFTRSVVVSVFTRLSSFPSFAFFLFG